MAKLERSTKAAAFAAPEPNQQSRTLDLIKRSVPFPKGSANVDTLVGLNTILTGLFHDFANGVSPDEVNLIRKLVQDKTRIMSLALRLGHTNPKIFLGRQLKTIEGK